MLLIQSGLLIRSGGARRLLLGLGGLLLTFLLALHAVAAEPRLAVVVGNDAYGAAPLVNAVNDARSITATLREVGFTVRHLENVTRADLASAVRAIEASLPRGGVGLFYYAGHAVQYQGVNYLLPVDFELVAAERLPDVAITVDEILAAMQAAGAGMSLIILDACRDNPFGEASGAYGPGLANMQRGSGESLIFFSAAEGAVALDGAGPNSPFTGALVSALERPGLDIYDISRQVRASVREATNGLQIPYVSGSIETHLVLRGEDTAETASAFAELGAEPGEISIASVHWHSIQRSADPGDYEEFISTYPDSPLAREAAVRREQLLARGAEETPSVRIAIDLPAIPGGLAEIVTECDIAAADPYDNAKVHAGIEALLVNTRLAIPVCARDVAADPANARLIYQLGRSLMIADRYEEARALFIQSAGLDYPAASTALGYLYRNGLGTERDYNAAFEQYRMAAIAGSTPARISLAVMFREGWGVGQSDEEAFQWMKLAAGQGSRDANDAIANMYRDGRGTEPLPNVAIEHYQRAAQLGSTNAMNNLGRVYRDGIGVEPDMDLALYWFHRAIAEGNAFAAEQLGRMHARGQGVPHDGERAMALLELAAERGNEWAYFHLAQAQEDGALGRPEPAQALHHFEIARLIGESIDNTASQRLAEQSRAAVDRLRARLGDAEARQALERAAQWFEANGTSRFVLAKRY